MKQHLFELPENIRQKPYVIASYYIQLDAKEDIHAKARKLAVGQTIGTWIEVPGITGKMEEQYCGKVVQIMDVPSVELTTQLAEKCHYIIRIAYPTVHFAGDFPLMLTALLGNDASTSAQVKLLDLEFPEAMQEALKGPAFGIEGLRALTGVYNRPLTLNMIKPCLGLTPEEGAKIFYDTALGGIDIIKDDELLGNPSYSKPWERVKAFKKASEAAYEITGKKTKYFVNVSGGTEGLMERIKRVQEAGADGLMLNYAFMGYSAIMAIRNQVDLPILGHGAGCGAMSEGVESGMTTPLCGGKLPRLSGVDLAVINTPYGGYPLTYTKYMQTFLQLSRPMGSVKRTMPIIGGGVHPGIVASYMESLGNDIVLAAGGAVQGHPMGSQAGAKAMVQAVDVALSGMSGEEAANQYKELAVAWSTFGGGQ